MTKLTNHKRSHPQLCNYYQKILHICPQKPSLITFRLSFFPSCWAALPSALHTFAPWSSRTFRCALNIKQDPHLYLKRTICVVVRSLESQLQVSAWLPTVFGVQLSLHVCVCVCARVKYQSWQKCEENAATKKTKQGGGRVFKTQGAPASSLSAVWRES